MDVELRHALCSDIVLTGGSTGLQILEDRLLREIKALLPKTKLCVSVSRAQRRANSPYSLISSRSHLFALVRPLTRARSSLSLARIPRAPFPGGWRLHRYTKGISIVDHGKDPTTGKDILVTLANGVEVQKRTLDAWTGGAILASLSTFAEMWMTRADFEEHGAARVLAGKSF